MRFKVLRFKKVKSTNNTAIRIIKSSKIENGMIISETQSVGRGQYGKKWISKKGNLFVSFFYNQCDLYTSIKELTEINCLLVKKLLSKYYLKKIDFKKPNDLLIKKKKICGILHESIFNLDRKYLIVGIGINLINNPIIKNYPTTNLYSLINKKISKKKIEMDLKRLFEKKINFLKKKRK